MGALPTALNRTTTDHYYDSQTALPCVFGGADACAKAVVASLGRADNIIDEERFCAMVDGDSSGILSVIAGACQFRRRREIKDRRGSFQKPQGALNL